jgi:hypothetical protein
VVRTPEGSILPSAAAAWRLVRGAEPGSSVPPPTAAAACAPVAAEAPRSAALLSLMDSLSVDPASVPPYVRTLARAATCAECPEPFRRAAGILVESHVAADEWEPCVRAAVASSPSGGDEATRDREVADLRRMLPADCEMRMLGSRAAYEQATRAIREEALGLKFRAAAGRRGANCARDRRALLRYLAFCRKAGVRTPWPVYSPVFASFLDDASRRSTGSKGGATVKHGLKVAFLHMRDHFGLPAELDAPVLFNMTPVYKGDSDTATSPSIWMVSEWERLSVSHGSAVIRLVCSVAVLASWLSLRAVHFVGATVLAESNEDDIRVNLARDKDGSTNVWAGCDAAGLLGRFTWWPAFMACAKRDGFLVPCITVSNPKDPDLASATVVPGGATSASMKSLWELAFVAVGVPIARQRALRFTGHSARHFLPCLAEVLMWTAALRDEVGRWATGAANAKRLKCGPRYTVSANRALQVFLRRQLRLAGVAALPEATLGSGDERVLPNFHDLADSPAIVNSAQFGGPSFVPGFGAVR